MSSEDNKPIEEKKTESPTENSDGKNGDEWSEALKEQASAEAQKSPDQSSKPSTTTTTDQKKTDEAQKSDRTPAFEKLTPDQPSKNSGPNNGDLSLIMDIPIQLTVELGHAKIEIRQLLNLSHGSIIELEGIAGDPMDVLVNGCLIAQGEIVVINEHFGIRLTDIITPLERIKRLSRLL